jgi:hypothetical protein
MKPNHPPAPSRVAFRMKTASDSKPPERRKLNPLRLHNLAKIAADDRAAGLPLEQLIERQRRVLTGALPHLLQLSDHQGLARPGAWAERHLPELVDEVGLSGVEQQIEDQGARPRLLSADALARLVGQTLEQRTRLKTYTIGAIDCSKAERETLRKTKDAERKRKTRAANGAPPHAESLSRKQPWSALGMSRSGFYKLPKEERDRLSGQIRPQQSIPVHIDADETVQNGGTEAVGVTPSRQWLRPGQVTVVTYARRARLPSRPSPALCRHPG